MSKILGVRPARCHSPVIDAARPSFHRMAGLTDAPSPSASHAPQAVPLTPMATTSAAPTAVTTSRIVSKATATTSSGSASERPRAGTRVTAGRRASATGTSRDGSTNAADLMVVVPTSTPMTNCDIPPPDGPGQHMGAPERMSIT